MNKKLMLMALITAAGLALMGCGSKDEYYDPATTGQSSDAASPGATPTEASGFVPSNPPIGPQVLVDEAGIKISAVSVQDNKLNLEITNTTEEDVAVIGSEITMNGIDMGGKLEAAIPKGTQAQTIPIEFDQAKMEEANVIMISTVELKIAVNGASSELLSTDTKMISATEL